MADQPTKNTDATISQRAIVMNPTSGFSLAITAKKALTIMKIMPGSIGHKVFSNPGDGSGFVGGCDLCHAFEASQ